MKEKLKKCIISLMIVISITQSFGMIIFSNCVYAEGDTQYDYEAEQNELERQAKDLGGDILDGLLGILLVGYRAGAYAIISLVRGLTGLITALGGGEPVWSIEGIIFTGAEGFEGTELVSVNFFDVSSNKTINTIRKNVAIWYYAMRNLAIVVSLGILLYVGIRMAISTVAEKEAKYKKMFTDWVVSLALIFVLHYIMIFTIELNNTLVTIIYNAAVSSNVSDSQEAGLITSGANAIFGTEFENAIDTVAANAFDPRFTVGVGNLVVYGVLVGITIIYLFMYIKRMLTVGFLIIISPLITITYSIDKMGDGKSQALNAWLKEFIYNVLIQTFHCIIYMVFVNTAIQLMAKSTLSASILAVLMILFMHQAEEIIKNIFNFNSKSLVGALGNTALVATGLSFIKKQGDKGAKAKVDSSKIPGMSFGGKAGTAPAINAQQNLNNATQGANQPIGGNQPLGSGQSTNGQPLGGTTTGGAQDDYKEPTTAQLIKGAAKDWGKKRFQNAKPSLSNLGKHMATGATLGLGMIALGTGQPSVAASGLYAGNSVKEAFGTKLDQLKADHRVQHNEEIFAGGYQNFANEMFATEGWTPEQTMAYTQSLLGKDDVDVDKMSEAQADYYTNYVQPLKETYQATGEKDVAKRFRSTIEMVHSGQIKPPEGFQPRIPQVVPVNDQQPQDGGAQPQNGGVQPQNGGAQPQNGGAQPQDSGAEPQGGGAQPQDGGAEPQNGGAQPQDGGAQPQNGGAEPQGGAPQNTNGADNTSGS